MLNVRELEFCRLKAGGCGNGEAYRLCGYGCKSEAVAQAGGGRLMMREEVQEEVLRLKEVARAAADEALCLSLVEKRVLLAEIARGKAVRSEGFLFEVLPSHGERRAAMAEDSKLAGHYAPAEVSVQGDLFSLAVDFFDSRVVDGDGGAEEVEGEVVVDKDGEGDDEGCF